MKFSNLFWALILIAIGLLILFSNFGWVDFHWISIWRLWPLILIFWGISILPVRDLFKGILVVGVLAVSFLFFNQITEPRWYITWNDHGWEWDEDWDEEWDEEDNKTTFRYETQQLSVPVDSILHKAILKMNAAAGQFELQGTTSELLTFKKSGDIGNYSMTTEEREGKTEISIQLEKTRKIHRIKKNQVDIQLNPDVVWDLDFDIGAASVELDLTSFKIDTANIDAGAASVELTFGDLHPSTYVTYSAGASSLKIRIPKGSACEIHSESVLVSRDFKGFINRGDGIFQTENYPEGTNTIIIHIESAVSSLEVSRY